MYYIKKVIEISAAHSLSLPYQSQCSDQHGHNWVITIECNSATLNKDGMVVDFQEIKRKVKDPLDHKVLNDVLPFNPTAENIAKWVCEQIETCFRVTVRESRDNEAVYVLD